MNTHLEELCKHLPSEFATYTKYCRGLVVGDRPDYASLRGIFTNLCFRQGCQYDFIFDWIDCEFKVWVETDSKCCTWSEFETAQ